MKTKEYIIKYNLSKSDRFSHKDFVSDLTIDFLSLLEIGKATQNIKGFENAVRAIRMKWDGVNNKTLGQLPEKLWRYFYAVVVMKMKEELFPEETKRKQEEKEAWERRKRERTSWENQYDSFFYFSMFASLFTNKKPVESFNILNISVNSTTEDVKLAYRNLAKQHHPDKGGDSAKFLEITEAKNKCLAYLK